MAAPAICQLNASHETQQTDSTAQVWYALGRAYLQSTWTVSPVTVKEYRARGLGLLERAATDRRLGGYRRSKANRWLALQR